MPAPALPERNMLSLHSFFLVVVVDRETNNLVEMDVFTLMYACAEMYEQREHETRIKFKMQALLIIRVNILYGNMRHSRSHICMENPIDRI